MRQLIQSYNNGILNLLRVPAAPVSAGCIQVNTATSLVSVGTEKYMLELAKKSLLGKALARPDLVRQVIAKAQAEGIMEAWRQAMGRLDTPVPLGYSSAGIVTDVGRGVEGFAVGDRVACTGSGFAGHAEVASVPASLCARIPDGVDFDSAAFVAVGGIALEAVRMAHISLGETVAVIGLGLIGQIAVQLLNAAGCRVVGMDVDSRKAELALQHGAEAVASSFPELLVICNQLTANQGVDAVVIFAATSSNEPLEQAAEVCRERGRVVAAGLVGLDIPRKPFYDKELELVVSRAWGPGLYDTAYTDKGIDYPLAYGRWTAKRNMEAFLHQLAKGTVRVDYLITHRFAFEQALDAYELIMENKEPYIGVLLTYPESEASRVESRVVWIDKPAAKTPARGSSKAGVGLIGAGQYASGTLLPAMKGLSEIRFRGVATSTGLSSRHMADKYGFDYCTTDFGKLLDDSDVDLIFVLTRHGSHAHLVAEALRAGKHVFVEKPLALSVEQLREVLDAYSEREENTELMVGFNRRFSPFSRWMKERFSGISEPLAVSSTVNAGRVPADHWTHDSEQGGGRILGEVCHFVDLIQYLTESLPVRVFAETLRSDGYEPSDNVVVTLRMANGAIGSITYLAGGDKAYPRETIEIFGGGAVGVIENFKAATFTRGGHKKSTKNWLSVDRGHRGEIEALVKAVRDGGPAPVDFEEYLYTTLATFGIEESLRTGQPVAVDLTALAGKSRDGVTAAST